MLNIWRRFGDLLRPAHQEVVTIVQIVGNGTVRASTAGGGQVVLRCNIDLAVNDRVFAAAGEVKSKAPDLPYHEIEV